MSFLRQFYRPSATKSPAQRTYSSFFSSKPGGGRYFNSSKPLNRGSPRKETGGNAKAAGSSKGNGTTVNLNGEEQATSSPLITAERLQQQQSPPRHAASSVSEYTSPPQPSLSTIDETLVHPIISVQDYKLNQFFSLHRPLLTLTSPASSIFISPSLDLPIFTSHPTSSSLPDPPATGLGTLDDPPESTPEADAEAARLIARALVMNRISGAAEWEHTLRRLGLDTVSTVEAEASDVQKEWEGIVASSVKRKRRKKMKLHKLKKRRKLQRATRLRLGK